MSEAPDPRSAEFERRTRALLEDSADALPARTRSRLTQARFAALEHAAHARAAAMLVQWQRWLPAGAVSAVVLAALLMQGGYGPFARPMQPNVATAEAADDLELLADRDALALAQDQSAPGADVDYEFYDWAVSTAQEETGNGVGS